MPEALKVVRTPATQAVAAPATASAPSQVRSLQPAAHPSAIVAEPQRMGAARDAGVLHYVAGEATKLPGFGLLALAIGENPISGERVDRSAANVLRVVLEVAPRGDLLIKALDAHGLIDRAGAWIDKQLNAVAATAQAVGVAIDRFIASLSKWDVLSLWRVWLRAKALFSEPIERLVAFARGLADGLVTLIKEAIVQPIGALAAKTRGWDLLRALLGYDPITSEAFPRDTETLLGGFLKLIGEEQTWQNIKQSGALAKISAWFEAALKSVREYVAELPQRLQQAFRSIDVADVIVLPRALDKLIQTFGDFAARFVDFAGKALWSLLEIVFSVLAPGVLPHLRKLGDALKQIFKNPVPFARHLVDAAKKGFDLFASRIGEHLKRSLIDWLTGSLPGVYIPRALSLREIARFTLSVLGLAWTNIRERLVGLIGGPAVQTLEAGAEILVAFITEGPAAAWDKIQGFATDLKDKAIETLTDFVVKTAVGKAVARLVKLLVPGGAFVEAIQTVYSTLQVFVDKLKTMAQVALAFLDSIAAISQGAIDIAAAAVEKALAGVLTLAINFLAGFAGLGKISDEIMKIIKQQIQPHVERALDDAAHWIAKTAKLIGAKIKSWWTKQERFTAEDGETHTLKFQGDGPTSQPVIASYPMSPRAHVAASAAPAAKKAQAEAAVARLEAVLKKSASQAPNKGHSADSEAELDAAWTALLQKLKELSPVSIHPKVTWGHLTSEGYGTCMIAEGLDATSEAVIAGGAPASAAPNNRHWDYLLQRKEIIRTRYVRGHLLNEKLGGPAAWQNLTPITQTTNKEHLTLVEQHVKGWLLKQRKGEPRRSANYSVIPQYGRSNRLSNLDSQLEKTPLHRWSVTDKAALKQLVKEEASIPKSLVFRAELKQGDAPPTVVQNTIANEPVDTAWSEYNVVADPRLEK